MLDVIGDVCIGGSLTDVTSSAVYTSRLPTDGEYQLTNVTSHDSSMLVKIPERR